MPNQWCGQLYACLPLCALQAQGRGAQAPAVGGRHMRHQQRCLGLRASQHGRQQAPKDDTVSGEAGPLLRGERLTSCQVGKSGCRR